MTRRSKREPGEGYMINDGKVPAGLGASRPVSDEARQVLAGKLLGLRLGDLSEGIDRAVERMRKGGQLYRDIAEEMLPLAVAEYERRLRETAEEHGPGMVRREPIIGIRYGESGRPEVRVEMDEPRRAQALEALTNVVGALESSFGGPHDDAVSKLAYEWLWALAMAALREGRVSEVPNIAERWALLRQGGDPNDEACAYLTGREGEPYRAMVRWFALDFSQRLVDWSAFDTQSLEVLVGVEPATPPQKLPMPVPKEGHYDRPSAHIYQEVSRGIANGRRFKRSEVSRWPRLPINSGGRTVGYAEMCPSDIDLGLLDPEQIEHLEAEMWRRRNRLSDLDADVLDGLTCTWLERSHHHPERLAYVMIDELLDLRQKQPKKGGGGRRGGYEPKQRRDVVQSIASLRNILVDMGEMQVPEPAAAGNKVRYVERRVRSYVITITDVIDSPQPRLDGYATPAGIWYRPGSALSIWLDNPHMRQMTLLAVEALKYDPYRQTWEKRLARSLSWRWRVGASREGQYMRPYKAVDLVRMADKELNERRPQETRERLEKALDVLKKDGVIAYWEPGAEGFENPLMSSRKGKGQRWLASTYLIEPPDVVKDLCDRVADAAVTRRRGRKRAAITAPEGNHSSLGKRLKSWRKERGIAQTVVADRLSEDEDRISQGTVSKIENGRADPPKRLREKIERMIGA